MPSNLNYSPHLQQFVIKRFSDFELILCDHKQNIPVYGASLIITLRLTLQIIIIRTLYHEQCCGLL